MGIDGAVEIGDGTRNWAQLDDDNGAKRRYEVHAKVEAFEMPGVNEPLEMGEGKTFAAGLEGSSVVLVDTRAVDTKDLAESTIPVDIIRA
jgi:hypothetical protein